MVKGPVGAHPPEHEQQLDWFWLLGMISSGRAALSREKRLYIRSHRSRCRSTPAPL